MFTPTRFKYSAVLLTLLSLTASAKDVETLKIGLAAEVSTLDPQFINTAPNVSFAHHIFETLVDVNPDGKLVPRLATSWKAIDATTWEFKLRHDVTFQDGSPLTADDVAYSLARPATLKNSPGPFTSYTKQIVAREVVDPYTIRLKTASPYGALPLDVSTIYIVSRKVAEKYSTDDFNAGKGVIGTGPFRLVNFHRGETITLARNDQYWGAKPEWKTAEFRILPSPAARLNALLAHDVDAIENIPPADISTLRKNDAVQVVERSSWRTIFWSLDQFNERSPDITDNQGQPLTHNPLKDIQVRKAIAKAINRQALSDRVLEGLGTPASNVNAPSAIGYNASIPVERYDPVGAKKLLAEAGYPDGFTLTLHGPNNRYIDDQQIVETTAQFLNKIGIHAKVVTEPFAVYLPKAKTHAYSMALLGWGSLAADFTLRTVAGTPNADTGWGSWNWGRYSNAQVDGAINKALASVDQKQRDQYAQQAAGIVLKDYGLIPSHYQHATWAVRKGLHYQARLDEFTFAEQFTSK